MNAMTEATPHHALPSRAHFWFYFSLILNIFFLLYSMSFVVKSGFLISIWYVSTALIMLTILLYARLMKEFVLYPLHVGALITFLFAAYLFSNNLFTQFTYIDIVLHFFGGLFAALYLLAFTHYQVHDFWALVLWGLGLAMLIGVFWEFSEFLVGIWSGNVSFLLPASDVLSDLLADFLGALLASVPFAWLVRPPRKFYRR